VPAPGTPTRLSVVSMPTFGLAPLNWPGLGEFGTPEPFGNIGLTPNGTAAAQGTVIAGWGDSGLAMVTRWYTSTNFAAGTFGTEITNTTGISTPVEIAVEMGSFVGEPFKYIRGVREYIPNMWPLVLFSLLVFLWVFFTIVVKWAVGVSATVAEVVRRIIELIPGF